MSNWTSADIPDQSGKIAIVTGANSGIGLETARELARKGAHVILAARTQSKGEAALEDIERSCPEARLELMSLDLADLSSVAEFASGVHQTHQAIDILINNAGVMMCPFGRTRDGFELQFGTNHLGHFALTAQLFELLARTPGARVVNVSSLAHRRARMEFDDLDWSTRRYSKLTAYKQSKMANLLFTHELARRAEAAKVDVVAVACHPGWTATNLQQHIGSFTDVFTNLLGMQPPQGALPNLHAAVTERAPGDYVGPDGRLQWTGHPKLVQHDPYGKDPEAGARLWSLSEELVGAPFALAGDYRALGAEASVNPG